MSGAVIGGPVRAGHDADWIEADAADLPDEPRHARGVMTGAALAFALGIALGWYQPQPWVWPWVIAAGIGACVLGAQCARVWKGRALVGALVVVALGAAWITVRQRQVHAQDLAACVGPEPVFVQVRGVALGAPVLKERTAGSLAQFDYREPATYFPLRVTALIDRHGAAHDMHGEVYVKVDGTTPPFRAGDAITTAGFLREPLPPSNPGEFDFRQYARSKGQAGLLMVRTRDLLHIESSTRPTPSYRWLRWRQRVQHRATATLLGDLPARHARERDALLSALLMGQRTPELAELTDTFRRVGLAHVLAISGLHLGVLVGFVLLVARGLGVRRGWYGWLILGTVLGYLVLVEVRLPVLRASVMLVVVGMGMIAGRRWRIGSLVALSAILLLIWRPDQLFSAGFQLSFGVVLGLIHFAPGVRTRWFGRPRHSPRTLMEMVGESTRTTFAAAAVAWLVASPIMMFHFGFISPLGAPLSVVVLPIVALLLATGFVKLVLAALLPSAGLILGIGLSLVAEIMLAIVAAADAMPGVVVHTRHPHALWTIGAVGLVAAWGLGWHSAGRWRAWGLGCAALALIAVQAWHQRALVDADSLRLDMLAVGDGTCHVVRGGDGTVIVDAGSNSDFNVGNRTLVPALRALGVRHVEALCITHPNIDHFNAVLELVDAFGIAQVFVTPQFLRCAEAAPDGAVGFVLEALYDRGVLVRTVTAGSTMTFGTMRWRWLNPTADTPTKPTNDTSMAVHITGCGSSILLTGDIEETAINAVLTAAPGMHADVMELPHHGSFNAASARLLDAVDPALVLQSTGWRRWERDAWEPRLMQQERTRLVTARDGACWVVLHDGCIVECGRFHGER
jgi:competence protein ComEC